MTLRLPSGVAKLLDSGLTGSDWRALADYLGYNSYKVPRFLNIFCFVIPFISRLSSLK